MRESELQDENNAHIIININWKAVHNHFVKITQTTFSYKIHTKFWKNYVFLLSSNTQQYVES